MKGGWLTRLHSKFKTKKIEKQGEYFNPIMATLITGSSRLMLAMAEKIASDKGYFAYCDTDSVFVKPEIAKDVQDFFKPLNPYSLGLVDDMFKIEDNLENVMFYGISAKRYCLYDIDSKGNITIRKYSSHALIYNGLKEKNGEKVWKSILTNNFSSFTDDVAIYQNTISKPSILQKFKKINLDKPFDKKIKPFNFVSVGSEKNNVIPCISFTKDIKGIQYMKFVDLRTGKTSDELELDIWDYWKTLEDILTDYVRHNDNKFDYDSEGIAHRKHIIADQIRYIGKESNNLDETSERGIDEEDYTEYTKDIANSEEFRQWVLSLMPLDVKDKEISKWSLERTQVKIKHNEILNPKTKTVKLLINMYKDVILHEN